MVDSIPNVVPIILAGLTCTHIDPTYTYTTILYFSLCRRSIELSILVLTVSNMFAIMVIRVNYLGKPSASISTVHRLPEVPVNSMPVRHALCQACCHGRCRDVVWPVIERPDFDPTVGDRFGRTLLHQAAAASHEDCVRRLLAAGRSVVNQQSRYGWTPVHFAVSDPACLTLLLDAGGKDCQLELRNYEGDTALALAAKKGNLDAVKILVDRGADHLVKVKGALTPLMLAVSGGHEDVTRHLLNVGGVGARGGRRRRDNEGRTALHHAARQDSPACAVALLGSGFYDGEVDSTAEDGATALALAARYGHVETAAVLVTRGGADPNGSADGDMY